MDTFRLRSCRWQFRILLGAPSRSAYRSIRQPLLEVGGYARISGGRVAVTTDRPAFFRWEGYVKHGPRDVVKAVHEARKRRGRI
jgi:hypothetical protein